jgi:hypothetical protein
MQQPLRVAIVIAHHVATIPLCRRRARAFVQDGPDRLGERPVGIETLEKIILIEVVSYRELGNIDELVTILQIVHDYDVVMTPVNESANEIAADKAGAACDYMH